MDKKDLREGDILLFPAPEDSWLSQAIALLTGSQVSHAALVYEVGENYTIAEATIGGIKYTPMPNEYPFVFRYHNISEDEREKLIHVMQTYVAEGNDYGYSDLVLLGVLLIYKKFSKKTLSNTVFYLFLLLVSFLLQKAVQKFISKGKHPMVCSQFAAQCYTDAKCDLEFKKMIIDYEDCKSTISNVNSVTPKDDIWQNVITLLSDMKSFIQVAFRKKGIREGFLLLLKEEEKLDQSNSCAEQLGGTIFSNPMLVKPAQRLVEILKPILLNQNSSMPGGVSDVSTIRNFFITPADLLINCSNTIKVGQLSENE